MVNLRGRRNKGTRTTAPVPREFHRIDDPEFAIERACYFERNNMRAVQVGLPSIGSTKLNKHGIVWEVVGHRPALTANTLQRWRDGSMDEDEDLFPQIVPHGFSDRLNRFITQLDLCTTKHFILLDTLPEQRKGPFTPGHNSIDTMSDPVHNIVFLDASLAHETVIAHEFGHAWVQYVDDCEDERALKEASDPARLNQVSFVQSYVLDIKVNELIHDKGFDMAQIEEDHAEGLACLARITAAGYKAENKREEVFMAIRLADQLLAERHLIGFSGLARMNEPATIVRRHHKPIYELAKEFANAVAECGYGTKAEVRASIDRCLLLSFAHTGDGIDLENDFVIPQIEEPDFDKWPDFLPHAQTRFKALLGRVLAREDIPMGWKLSIADSEDGGTMLLFEMEDGRTRGPYRIPYPCPIKGRRHDPVELMREARRNREKMEKLMNQGTQNQPPYRPPSPPGMPQGHIPRPPQPPFGPDGPGRRFYMAGLGRFLTRVREYELLGGEHPYAFANNNPVTYSDPSGLSPNCQGIPTPFGPIPFPGGPDPLTPPELFPVSPPWPGKWPPGKPKDPCWRPAAGHFTPIGPGKSCDRYLTACLSRGSILACNMYYVCMGAGLPGYLPPISGPGADCVRGCLLSVLGGQSLASCRCSYAQHQECFSICKWAPPWPFNWASWSYVCSHHVVGAPDPGPKAWPTP